ncbi:unnamed protein product [Staurois parvus]|uniref:C2H2-type domain-containing protein n=1 Tax=Staurois parvus TaxID=386267 RepID=A0ABN9G0Q1_9NEOB|nr:unnamed protein product [Staurois parvus]
MMEDHSIPHHHQVDGSSHGNPPERCPRSLYSRDSTQEGHTIPHHHHLDGSGNGNPPERCPHPQCSQDSLQEGHTIPHHHQHEEQMYMEVKEEEEEVYVMHGQHSTMEDEKKKTIKLKESLDITADGSSHGNPPERCPHPLYSRDSTQEDHTIPHHHQEDGSNNGNPPERCPQPLYSRDSTQKGHIIPHHHQHEEWMYMKFEVKEEEEEVCVMDYQQSTEEAEMMERVKQEEPSPDISDGSSNENPPERCPRPLYSWDSTQEDHTIPHHHQHEEQMYVKVEVKEEEEETSGIDYQQSTEEVGMIVIIKEEEPSLDVSRDRRTRPHARPWPCSQCAKSFVRGQDLLRHERSHTGETSFSVLGVREKFHSERRPP